MRRSAKLLRTILVHGDQLRVRGRRVHHDHDQLLLEARVHEQPVGMHRDVRSRLDVVHVLHHGVRLAMSFYRPHPTCQIPDLDAKLTALFGRRTLGTYVMVGAYDGESFGPTSCLADLGWRGLEVEASPELAMRCALRHANNNVRVFPCAAGAERGRVTLHLGGTLSTTSARQVEVYEQIPWAQGNHSGETITVAQYRLDDLLEQARFPLDFDLLVIDVEGSEGEVLKGLAARWRPRVMIVEIEDEHPDLMKFEDLRQRALLLRQGIHARGYRGYFRDRINTIFVRDDLPLPA